MLSYQSIDSLKIEKELMEKIRHPFLVGLEYVFQTPLCICFVTSYYM